MTRGRAACSGHVAEDVKEMGMQRSQRSRRPGTSPLHNGRRVAGGAEIKRARTKEAADGTGTGYGPMGPVGVAGGARIRNSRKSELGDVQDTS